MSDPPEAVYQTLVDVLWDTSSARIPSSELVERWQGILMQRPDSHCDATQASIQECKNFLAA
ncbi:MAG: hypothetical protein CMP06_08330 [Xanthomonadales bacterium]|nr:hypothetical protein [Xanthomonadales bacterium]